MYFEYGEAETGYLARRDKRLGEAIERIGPIRRAVDSDLFCSIVHHIVGQQISTKAQATIWQRMRDAIGHIDPQSIGALSAAELQRFGLTHKKAGYIKSLADKVAQGEFDIEALADLSDGEVIRRLCTLDGVGVWTAEMLLTFCLQRPDVISYGDLAILRGLRMLYRHKSIDRARFERYRRRYSPCGTVASLYLWAIAGGAIEGLTDPAVKRTK